LSNFSLTNQKTSITVKNLFLSNAADFKAALVGGNAKSLQRKITSREIHYPGLALTGFMYHFHYKKIQFVADMEWHYLNSLTRKKRTLALKRFFKHPVPLIVITRGRKPHKELLDCAEALQIPVYQSKLSANVVGKKISTFLEDYFAPQVTVHATLVDVYGIGLLYTGKSGIGKSECALDLVERGHRMVADDIITITRKGESLIGQGSSLLGHHMEIRGVGIIDMQSLFGIRAIRINKKIEVMVELVEWNPKKNFERLGISENTTEILGIKIDKVTIPIFPGKNITVISEVIAMNILLKYNGIHTAREFNQKLIDTLKAKHMGKIKKHDKG
jgi:HPr kinase/phosphorylase